MLVALQVLFNRNVSFQQKWLYFRWPHPWFWLILFRSKRWQAYVERDLNNFGNQWWNRWIPGAVDVKNGWVTFTGTKCTK